MLLNAFLRNGYARTNGNKSWELTDLQFLFLTPDMAQAFLKFTDFPLYKKQFFELEISLMRERALDISRTIGAEPFNLIDIWCGDGLKAVEFIKILNSVSTNPIPIRYCPINASTYLIDLAIDNVKKANLSNVIDYKSFLSSGDGRCLRDIKNELNTKKFEKNVALLVGGVLSCYEINSYLFELNRDLKKGDVLIIGNGVRVGDRLVEIDKYKSSAFKKWYDCLIKNLEFNEQDVEFDARFGNSRVEMFYRLKKTIIKKSGKHVIQFNSGDELVVGALYKYYADEFYKFCNMYFADTQVITDKEKGYALVLCKK